MSDRGDYRSFYTVFWDDEDVHSLPDDAYRVLTTLRGTLPASGIGFVYPVQLAVRCGKTPEQIEAALRRLEQPKGDSQIGWIVRERGVVWIVNALRFEPSLSWKNRKHRDFVRDRHIAPLGSRTAIIAAFRAQYPEWFPADEVAELPAKEAKPAKSENPIPRTQDRVSSSEISPVQSNPAQPNDADDDSAAGDTAVGSGTVDDGADDLSVEPATALQLAVWANLAVAERWSEKIEPYTAANALVLERDLREAGIPARIAELSIWRQCRESKAEKRPGGPSYFKPGIEDDWGRALMRRKLATDPPTAPPRVDARGARDQSRRFAARRETAPIPAPPSTLDQHIDFDR